MFSCLIENNRKQGLLLCFVDAAGILRKIRDLALMGAMH